MHSGMYSGMHPGMHSGMHVHESNVHLVAAICARKRANSTITSYMTNSKSQNNMIGVLRYKPGRPHTIITLHVI